MRQNTYLGTIGHIKPTFFICLGFRHLPKLAQFFHVHQCGSFVIDSCAEVMEKIDFSLEKKLVVREFTLSCRLNDHVRQLNTHAKSHIVQLVHSRFELPILS